MAPLIDVQGISFVYPDGNVALREASLAIAEGERVALVGPNGAGKSTLLLHVIGILHPAAGAVRVMGLDVRAGNLPRVRAAVGLVFQDPDDQLFSPTVFDDVAFGPIHQGLPPDEVRARAARALDAVHMGRMAGRAPHHLSDGEKKRVAVATVLAMAPVALLLDEPAAGLDARARRGLIGLLRELPQAMLVATHDLRLVQELLSRTIVMDEGAIVADGPTAEILADAALLEAHGLEAP